jgi:SAM-dependent methyltransferase
MNEKDLSKVKEHWEKEDTVSLKDENLRTLEQNTIIENLKKINKKTLKDIGCGDAGDTIEFSKYMDKVYAYDYSKAMLRKASINIAGIDNITLNEFDILNDQLEQKTDVVITKRMLINLGDYDNQKKAIRKIYNSINDNGYFIMLETSIEGLENLNGLRKNANLPSIPAPHHNTLFLLEELKNYLSEYFLIEDVKYFSSYYFFTRVYNQMLQNEDMKKYDIVAKNISLSGIDLFKNQQIGPQFCMLLRKK